MAKSHSHRLQKNRIVISLYRERFVVTIITVSEIRGVRDASDESSSVSQPNFAPTQFFTMSVRHCRKVIRIDTPKVCFDSRITFLEFIQRTLEEIRDILKSVCKKTIFVPICKFFFKAEVARARSRNSSCPPFLSHRDDFGWFPFFGTAHILRSVSDRSGNVKKAVVLVW